MRGLLSIDGNEQNDRPGGGTLTGVPGIDRERLLAWDRVRELVEECVRLHERRPVRSAGRVDRHGPGARLRSVRPDVEASEPDASGPTETPPRRVSPQKCRRALRVPEPSCDRSRATAWRMPLAGPDNRSSRWNVCRASAANVVG